MNRFAPLLMSFVLLMASTLRAAREYIQYDIAEKTIQTVTAPADGVAALALNTAEKILFVRDTDQSDATYYIAVYELTNAQASNLGWTESVILDDSTNAAFGGFQSTTKHPLALPLAYPTQAQWKAYVETTPKTPCNVNGGTDTLSALRTTTWYTNYILTGKTAINDYGLYDTFGNVAECTIEADGTTIRFLGGYTSQGCDFEVLKRDDDSWCKTLGGLQSPTPIGLVAGVRPVYLPPLEQTYTVTVTLDGKTVTSLTQSNIAPGTTVTVTPPEPNAGYVLDEGYTVTPDTITALTFDMPTTNVTFAYTSSARATVAVDGGTSDKTEIKPGETFTLTADSTEGFLYWEGPAGLTDDNKTSTPLAITLDDFTAGATLTYTAVYQEAITIQVVGGTASPSRIYEDGDTVTLTPDGEAWEAFSHWSGDYGITDANKTTVKLTLKISGIAFGTTLNYTANFTRQPRVLVFGGTATTRSASDDYGNGYYAVGATLTLTPHENAPEGYAFSHWLTHDGVEITNSTYNVGAIDTVATLTAVYQPDESVANTEVMHIGVISEENLTATTAMGYVAAEKAVESVYQNNTIRYYEAVEPESDYARLDFAAKTIDYTTTTETNANSTDNRTMALIMKRVKPGEGQPYYLGIHEVTEAQYERLVNASTNAVSRLPYVTDRYTRDDADTFLTALSTTFGETFSKPTTTQIKTISTGHLNNTQEYGDESITDAMVNSSDDNAGLLSCDNRTVDPYGFYDLWGNASEPVADDANNLYSGYYGTSATFCNFLVSEPANGTAPGAIRPAIEVQPRVAVTVTNLDSEVPFEVLVGQTITLKKQVYPGRVFEGWEVNGTLHTDIPKTITVTEATTLTACFSEALVALSLTYEGNCIGPSEALPGATINLYAADPAQALETLTVSPAEAATIDLEQRMITLSASATGAITISTAAAEVAPGFRFLLR